MTVGALTATGPETISPRSRGKGNGPLPGLKFAPIWRTKGRHPLSNLVALDETSDAMNPGIDLPILRIALTAVAGGILGGAAMIGVIRLITRAEWARFDMIVALGSMFTRTRENAFQVGAVVHGLSAIGFALLYTVIMWKFGLNHLPMALFSGTAFGIVHGMIVSLALVWVVAERHPLEEFREAGLAVGLVHFAGHVAYGAVVGLVIGLAST
jgi:hypothetical protein